jgi:Mn-dependent DtxR family transcriptional regulator
MASPKRQTPARPEVERPQTWTFLTNHAHVLISLADDPTLRIRDLAARVGITERAIQRIIADLEEAGYLTHEREGRRNLYRVRGNRPLRHPVEAHQTVAALLGALRSGVR